MGWLGVCVGVCVACACVCACVNTKKGLPLSLLL